MHLTEPFDASAVTLNLCGYQRSHFNPTSAADQFQASQGVTRLAKSLLSVNFVVAEFPDGNKQNGQSEYAFSLSLPDSVNETLMLQFDSNNLSITYYLRAQLEPRELFNYANL